MPNSLDTGLLSAGAATQVETSGVSLDMLRDMYRKMLLIRRVEESLLAMAESGKIGGAMHTAIGHEGNAVGVAAALQPGDYVTTTYRGHHHALARGMDPVGAIAEVLGRSGGVAKGKGGSMHFIQTDIGMMGANGIVGAQVPQATGMALASYLRGEDRVAVTFFGEGAMFQGVMHETFNIASKWQLPVVFYCENNRYSEMTPTFRTSSPDELYRFVQAYGIPSIQIDGNDVEAVYQAATEVLARARAGNGPSFVEGLTYRLKGHMAGDPETYRAAEEVEYQRQHEPLVVARKRLVGQGVAENELASLEADVMLQVEAAVAAAEASPWPDRAEAFTDVFAP